MNRSRSTFEFRVVFQREGKVQHVRRYATRKGADRRLAVLTSDEPWLLFGKSADDLICCSGRECGCEGLTQRTRHEKLKTELPRLLYARLEQRQIGPWRTVEKETQ
jgi:hypothetical protein